MMHGINYIKLLRLIHATEKELLSEKNNNNTVE
jgi:hypothetical protein